MGSCFVAVVGELEGLGVVDEARAAGLGWCRVYIQPPESDVAGWALLGQPLPTFYKNISRAFGDQTPL